jgi:hypothetical protein
MPIEVRDMAEGFFFFWLLGLSGTQVEFVF